jgi:HAD superfamily hydrolase (TIGR01509 family)
MEIRALVFDFDDTLVQSERLNDLLLGRFLKRQFDVTLTERDIAEIFGYAWKEAFSTLAPRYGIHETAEGIQERFLAFKLRSLKEHRLKAARGADLMLSLPVPRAIVSGSARVEIDAMLENAGIRKDAFAAVISADDCLKYKPDPEGFLRAFALLGVSAAHALVFEDSPTGIEAARAAGAPVAFVREFARMDLSERSDVSFDSLQEAYPWVKGRIRKEPEEGMRG